MNKTSDCPMEMPGMPGHPKPKQFGKDNGAGKPTVNTADNGPGGPKTSR